MAAPAFSVQSQNAARLADPALRQALLRYARRRLPAAEVEDLVQNTLTDALVSANAPSDDSEFQRWVHGIARHKIADSYRRRGRLPILDPDIDAKAGDAFAETGELTQWIERELPKTDGANATLHWLLRESDGESLDEIARDAALPAPRVRQRVSRLRRHFHARWLAIGAAGLILLLAAGLLLRRTRAPSSVPPIAREPSPPIQQVAPKASESAPPLQELPAGGAEKKRAPKRLKQLGPRKAAQPQFASESKLAPPVPESKKSAAGSKP
jgi:RNA polymerase sigma factor (sigma-70 family)